ncbi:hypothetical protein BDZ97DRAFT_1373681 [Flammula alnicola]|nr:hypothetical protein BDZ97DRAFT_1373681 [Flammula alnicola]
MLGAVDTMGHKGPTTNDEIATQGRLEMERGLANMKGTQPSQVQHTTGGTGGTGTTAATQPTSPYGQHAHNTDTGATGSRNVDPVLGYKADELRGHGMNDPNTGTGTGTGMYGKTSTNTSSAQDSSGIGADGGGSGTAAATTGAGDQGDLRPQGGQHASTGMYGSESTNPSHHREDSDQGMPENQHEAQAQALNQHHQLPGQNVGAGSDSNQTQQGSGGQNFNASPDKDIKSSHIRNDDGGVSGSTVGDENSSASHPVN